MKITHLGMTRRGRVTLHLDGEYHTSLHPDAAHRLTTGQELDEETLEELLEQSGFLTAKARALDLLSRRSYSGAMLYKKLCEKESEQVSAAAVARMTELGLIDDEDWARRYARDCMNRRGFSSSRTLRELMTKGIDRDLAALVLEELDDDPRPAIARIVTRKYLQAISGEKGYRRAFNALLRLGYRHGDIRAVLEHLQEDEDYYAE